MHRTYTFVYIPIGTYDPDNGKLLNETSDIRCTDKYNFCSEIEWSNSSWNLGHIPLQNVDPPLKDTIVVPTGILYLLFYARYIIVTISVLYLDIMLFDTQALILF